MPPTRLADGVRARRPRRLPTRDAAAPQAPPNAASPPVCGAPTRGRALRSLALLKPPATQAVPSSSARNVPRGTLPGAVLSRHGQAAIAPASFLSGSPAGYAAWPGAVGYGAARQAVRGFTEALAADLRETRIGVTAVVAGHVDSEYFAHNPGSLERMPAIDRVVRRLSPGDVAEAIRRGVKRERSLVVEPFEVRSLLALSRVAPGLTRRLAAIGTAQRAGARSG